MALKYDPGNYIFAPSDFLPWKLFAAVTDIRVDEPHLIYEEAYRLKKREKLTNDGKLVIVATDHPGRRVTTMRDDSLGMANRYHYLARALRVVTTPGCDGIMGTTDFMEDLLILSALTRGAGLPSFLDEKVLIGCMNRGGHAGVNGEIDDRFTCFTAESLTKLRFQGGKLMYRIDPEDERSIKAIDDCARAVTELGRAGLKAFLEPMTVRRTAGGQYVTDESVEALARDAGAASALGESSAGTWLKLSYAEGYEKVSRSTTLPILMLGGPARENPTPTLRDFHAGMQAGPNVRGVMVGRNVTFVHHDDPRAVAAAVASIVHDTASVNDSLDVLHEQRGRDMDLLAAAGEVVAREERKGG